MTEEVRQDIEVSYVHTTCRHCVFAEFKDKTQTGCALNKLQDYRDAGVEILEVFDDTDTNFSLINGRFCLFYRNEEVMKSHPRNMWEKITKLSTKCAYQVIVFFEPTHHFIDLKRILKNLKNTQEIEPNLVTVINKQYLPYSENPTNFEKPSHLLELLTDLNFHQFSLKNVYDGDLTDRALLDLVFDSTVKLPYPMYTAFRANFNIPEDFSKNLNDAILIKMMQLGFVTPLDDLNGMIVNKTLHKKHSGNAFGIHLEDKLLEFEDNGASFIHRVEDICPSITK